MTGSRPGERRGGRKAGTPNKLTRDIRELILAALSDAGGRAYLAQQARDNPGAFLALVGRCLPRHVDLTADVNVQTAVRRDLVDAIVELMAVSAAFGAVQHEAGEHKRRVPHVFNPSRTLVAIDSRVPRSSEVTLEDSIEPARENAQR